MLILRFINKIGITKYRLEICQRLELFFVKSVLAVVSILVSYGQPIQPFFNFPPHGHLFVEDADKLFAVGRLK